MHYLLLIAIFLVSPVLIIILTEKNEFASRIGSILIAYGFGILLGNINLYPQLSLYLVNYVSAHTNTSLTDVEFLFRKGIITGQDVIAFKIYKLQDILLMISIPLAIPLLLFSMKIKSWFRMAGKTFLSMILALVSVAIFGSLLLHTLLCKICKIDTDTLMITSTALICSPPFVPMIAGALKNREIIVSGLTVGIIGYAIGNYWGVFMSIILK